MKIWQITPRFSPAICGVGDYARIVGGELKQDWDITSLYAVADLERPPEALPNDQNGIFALRSHSSHQFYQRMQQLVPTVDALVLQASFYGYSPRGMPFWLARLLAEWRAKGGPPVLTMFHELYASGPVSSMSFWYGLLQKWLLIKVANYSAAIRTNRQASMRWLARHSRHKEDSIATLPVFSNLGEVALSPDSFSDRRLAVIAPGVRPGSPVWPLLIRVATALGCKEILLTGPNAPATSQTATSQTSAQGLAIRSLGVLEAAAFSQLMKDCQFGFLDYNPDFLAKSGHLAAFAAHGVVPIIAAGRGELPDGLEEGRHYLSGNLQSRPSIESLHAISAGIQDWYAPHSVGKTAVSYAQQLKSIVVSPQT